ncbi:twitching motility protein PilT [Verrucomicrobiota bacterium]|jgi:predicted nucleic acid-binding protein|nr:twitching motility protein PilT [Verrucomicrobiota bacterium]
MRFADTNVLLYSVSTVPEETAKARMAKALLANRDIALSVQVLQEFYVQATRASRTNRLTHDEAVGFIRTWRRFLTQELSLSVLDDALALKSRFQISYWDAAILAAARAAGCTEVLSEDLNEGQDYGGVIIVNPFK